MTGKKVAIVHDYIKEYGGAERVLETLHSMYPDSVVYTLVYCPQFLGPHKERFKNWKIKTSFLQYLPYKEKFISIFRIIAPVLFQQFNFTGYDVIIVSAAGAYTPNMIRKGSAKQICYCHTPPRYLYGYATARDWKKYYVLKIIGEVANHFLRMVDYVSAQRVDLFIANSENVKKRIKKFYRKDAIVVYPPVITSVQKKQQVKNKQKQYYLAGGRLARPKHYDLLIKACTHLSLSLKIFGKGFAGYGEELQEMAGQTVEFLGEITDNEKYELMQQAKAFLFAGEEEDFGITPVEAMSMGTPVLAYKSGGLVESVLDGKTGIFFEKLTVDSLVDALKRFEKITFNPLVCERQAAKFSEKAFTKGIMQAVSSL